MAFKRLRYGRLKLNASIMEDERYFGVFASLSLIPAKVDWVVGSNDLHITAISPLFDYVEEGNGIPIYDITLKAAEDGTIILVDCLKKWVRAENENLVIDTTCGHISNKADHDCKGGA